MKSFHEGGVGLPNYVKFNWAILKKMGYFGDILLSISIFGVFWDFLGYFLGYCKIFSSENRVY